MSGGTTVRRRGWTALIIAAVAEISVLGAVGIYGSVAGGRTFESGAFWSRALPPTSPGSPSQSPAPTPDAVDAEPVEVDACALITPAEINRQLDARFKPDWAVAGPGGPGLWSDEEGWWVSCTYEEDPLTERTFDVTVFTGPDLDQYLPDYIDPEPLAGDELPDETARAIPGLGEEAWIVAVEGEAVVTVGVRSESAVVHLDYALGRMVNVNRPMAVIASGVLVNLPDLPKITPIRLGTTCSAFELDGAAKFFDAELTGGRELENAAGDVTCGFSGYGGSLHINVLAPANVADERSFFREAGGQALEGVGDEAYSIVVDEEDDQFVLFYVRDGERVFEVAYALAEEEPAKRSEPTAAEIALLKSLLENGDVIGG